RAAAVADPGDDLGDPVAVDVADGHVHPAAELRLVGEERALPPAGQVEHRDHRPAGVAGPGDTGGPMVAVFNLAGRRESAFFAYEPEFRGGVNVAVGDVDGNGIAEIVTGVGNGGSS